MWTNLKSQSRPEMVGIFINRLFLSSRCYQKGLYKYWISRWIGSLFWETRTTREELWSNVVYRIIKMIHPDWIFNIDPLKKKRITTIEAVKMKLKPLKTNNFTLCYIIVIIHWLIPESSREERLAGNWKGRQNSWKGMPNLKSKTCEPKNSGRVIVYFYSLLECDPPAQFLKRLRSCRQLKHNERNGISGL